MHKGSLFSLVFSMLIGSFAWWVKEWDGGGAERKRKKKPARLKHHPDNLPQEESLRLPNPLLCTLRKIRCHKTTTTATKPILISLIKECAVANHNLSRNKSCTFSHFCSLEMCIVWTLGRDVSETSTEKNEETY